MLLPGIFPTLAFSKIKANLVFFSGVRDPCHKFFLIPFSFMESIEPGTSLSNESQHTQKEEKYM